MLKKIKPLIIIAIVLVVLFLISFKMAQKITRDKNEATPVVATMTDGKEAESTSAAETTTAAASETSTAAVTDNSTVLPTPTTVNMPTDDSWCTVLLNKYYKMNDTYEPIVEIAIEDSGIYLEERVAEKFREMYSAAMADGVTLTPAAGYVSLDRQERKFTKQVNLYVASGMTEEEAKAKTAFTVLPAGCSESNYGLAVDIGWLSEDFSESPAYQWLKSHAAEYGFIERYTADKTDYTHFNAQPWHWRYVGTTAAKAMNEQGLCLEEYLGKVN